MLQSSKPDKQEVSDNVKVVVRCRPLNQKEKLMGHKQSVIVDEIRGTITVNKLETSQEPPKTFTFDTVFGPDSKQLDVYNLTARPIIDSVLEGYNGKVHVIKPVLQNIITPSVIAHILHLKLYCSSLFFCDFTSNFVFCYLFQAQFLHMGKLAREKHSPWRV